MKSQRRYVVVGGAILALAVGGTGAAVAIGSGDDGDSQATGPGAERARAVALKLTGGGTVNAVERDSEDGATWEVEVTKPDGNTVDVRLDEHYRTVAIESDDDTGDRESE